MNIAEQLHAVVEEIENDQIGEKELAAIKSARSRLNRALTGVEIYHLEGYEEEIWGEIRAGYDPGDDEPGVSREQTWNARLRVLYEALEDIEEDLARLRGELSDANDNEKQAFTFTEHELELITSGLEREASEARNEYRRCHRRNAPPSVLARELARKQELLDLIDRLDGVRPARVSYSPEWVAEMLADLEGWGLDVLGNTDAEIVASWTLQKKIQREHGAA